MPLKFGTFLCFLWKERPFHSLNAWFGLGRFYLGQNECCLILIIFSKLNPALKLTACSLQFSMHSIGIAQRPVMADLTKLVDMSHSLQWRIDILLNNIYYFYLV